MVKRPTLVTNLVKETICDKAPVDGMEKHSYLPSCLQQCPDICGVRCKGECVLIHPGSCKEDCPSGCSQFHPAPCRRGRLDEDFLFCPSSRADTVLNFMTFETVPVPTYGKGAAYTRVDQVGKQQFKARSGQTRRCRERSLLNMPYHIVYTAQCTENCTYRCRHLLLLLSLRRGSRTSSLDIVIILSPHGS